MQQNFFQWLSEQPKLKELKVSFDRYTKHDSDQPNLIVDSLKKLAPFKLKKLYFGVSRSILIEDELKDTLYKVSTSC